MIYEMRIYRCCPGRLPALLNRFQTATLELWKKHGIRQAGFWTVAVGDGSNRDLYYLLQWESMGEREKVWAGFMSDPDWIEKRAASEKDGPIIEHITNMFLAPTAFSSVK
jgi:NIPSNAP